jgi:hypothetical protein
VSERCCDASEEAGESLVATAVTARTWLVVEVPGAWPRDVSDDGALPSPAQARVGAWLEQTPASRLQFVRRRSRPEGALHAFVVTAEEDRRTIRVLAFEDHEELAALDLDTGGDTFAGPLVLVCGHGSRDRCCARRGTSVYEPLDDLLADDELWISSHQGGHRFAANVLVLPFGLQFGRVAPPEAQTLVRDAVAGRIALDRYRGRTCYEPRAMAAEHAVRRAAGLTGLDDLRFAGERDGVVAFRAADGTEWRSVVEEATGPAVPASCGVEPSPQRSFSATVL